MSAHYNLKLLFMCVLVQTTLCLEASENPLSAIRFQATQSPTPNYTTTRPIPFEFGGSIDLPISLGPIHINLSLPMEAVCRLTGLLQICYGTKLAYEGMQHCLRHQEPPPVNDIEQGLIPNATPLKRAARSGCTAVAAGALWVVCGLGTAYVAKFVS